MDVSIFLDPEFMTVVFYFFAFGFISWFMGWGVAFVTSIFIKIIKKGV